MPERILQPRAEGVRELRGDFGSILAEIEASCTLAGFGYVYQPRRQWLTLSLQERLQAPCATGDHGLCVPVSALVLACALHLKTYDLHHVSDRLAAVLQPHHGARLVTSLARWYNALYRGGGALLL